ncbi:3-carboxy-cis,cis-muconate cycloisomerase [Roseobacter denitrificans]|uniref:3-carboxy-cis,cis-muconate cycloisomerase, putative n=1 Tax=Roseobacter denitrificans (strain ATCC 33942 / OCh 114) TaxID=375451 RepID=Q161F2_ROSDO|nr:lyase family protein [Roseobacter denitrificans]ABG33391.1 3-carboxy-cis,cis-muconate cycloisomerase, putative [Roseobacter denitrificans OCh 114]AVL52714.1 3-carboxy-cis,cis-muconate cycloisomerase [Roseobacter denitrificans]SFG23805.1 3-carboxy-cis,cis-muconate cycloisomerase [Roseobacter denitrificans OCh 114]
MAASVFDSPLYSKLFPVGETGRLFSDSAAIRAMLLVEGALAKAQGKLGIIPETSAAAIHRATLEIQIDPGALATSTGQNGVCVPGLVDAFRAEMNAPEHAQFVHWGATSQDIIDTALMLRLRQALALAESDLSELLSRLAAAAEEHATTPMAARTYGQVATPTTWGAVVAQWGMPLADALDALPHLRQSSLFVSLSGASGTSAALGAQAPDLRRALAAGLGLQDPERSWHTDRTPLLRISDWLGHVATILGSMGSSLNGLAASGIDEVAFDRRGASSTMPQKQNPIAATGLVALSNQSCALRAGMTSAAQHRHQRDGTAWFSEWMLLPQIVLTTASALQIATGLAGEVQPNVAQMQAGLETGNGLIHAEALSFALSQDMPRPQAQAATKALCAQAVAEGASLPDLARAAYPHLPQTLFQAGHQLGQAPEEARAFAARIMSMAK